uniref:Uncharacterized protein n=1 Tax=viral metagenome TaxID=1070528 RepID=A0A6M3L519_9ZZZZ
MDCLIYLNLDYNSISDKMNELDKIPKTEVIKIKQRFYDLANPVKMYQGDTLVKLHVLLNDLFEKYRNEEGVQIKDIAQISKNIIGLTDKMRRQDEGIKIQQDIALSHHEFRRIMEAEAKILEEQEKKDGLEGQKSHKKLNTDVS